MSGAKSGSRLKAPLRNAFVVYDDILNSIKMTNNKLVLLSLGPTATVLAYDLGKDGFQAIDIGHLDWEYSLFLKKATSKNDLLPKYLQS